VTNQNTRNVPATTGGGFELAPASKSLFIKTFGCQMNVYDSERISELLVPLGYTIKDALENVDMAVLNTCHIREKASEKLFSELGRLRAHKRRRSAIGKQMIIAVAGCVAQAIGEEIARRVPEVDIVVGPQTYHRLPELISRIESTSGDTQICTEFPVNPKFDELPVERKGGSVSAFLSVQEGCDKFCTFCVVPYTRGAEYSRPVDDLVTEAKLLVECGVKEITLLGQNVNAYHGQHLGKQVSSLSVLIERLAALKGLSRLRYTTSHPKDMDLSLIDAHGRIPELMPSVHLPVQSGSDRILEAMNRRYTVADYLGVVDKLRTARPDIALSSDFIVGFPGETEEDFRQTMNLVKTVGYAQAYSFKYSPRPGTPAAAGEIQIEDEIKWERLQVLQNLLVEQQSKFNQSLVGAATEILIEKPGRYPGQLVGRTPYLQPVHVAAKSDNQELNIGDIIQVNITGSSSNSLMGTLGGDYIND